jgi:hypothetical protein
LYLQFLHSYFLVLKVLEPFDVACFNFC